MTDSSDYGGLKRKKSKHLYLKRVLRMKESVVLIESLTPTCTELARHLVLSGINL